MIVHGLAPSQTGAAASLYWDAFGRKFGITLGPPDRGIALLERTLVPDRALAAVEEGLLVGLVGFHLDGTALVGFGARDLRREFGPFGGSWRAALLALLDRSPKPGELLLDGIVVHPDHRGRGIGTRLLRAAIELARERGLGRVRLDVVDTNPDARRLYERTGFVATRTDRTPYLRRLFGFGAATEMVLTLVGSAEDARSPSAPGR